MNREKAHEVFARYEAVKRIVSDLQNIVRNPDFVSEELVESMLVESTTQTQTITAELVELQKEIESLLQEVGVKEDVLDSGLVQLVVDCMENDPIDFKCGGPRILGFDFFVKPDECDTRIEEIKALLLKYKRPLMSVRTVPCVPGKQYTLWSLDSIEKEIKEGY